MLSDEEEEVATPSYKTGQFSDPFVKPPTGSWSETPLTPLTPTPVTPEENTTSDPSRALYQNTEASPEDICLVLPSSKDEVTSLTEEPSKEEDEVTSPEEQHSTTEETVSNEEGNVSKKQLSSGLVDEDNISDASYSDDELFTASEAITSSSSPASFRKAASVDGSFLRNESSAEEDAASAPKKRK